MMLTLQSFERSKQILVLFYHLHLCVFRNTGEIIVPPTDEEAVVSQNVTLKCQSNIKIQFPVTWRHKQLGSNKYDEPLYEDGYFFNGFKNGNGNGNGHPLNYIISGSASDGEFNLVISNVVLQNAGRYTCRETSKSEKRAELIVYESYPDILDCSSNQPSDGFIGANDCGIMPDTVRLSCNVSYRGNLEPVLEWKQGNVTLSNAIVKKSDSFIMSSIELKADEISSPDFQCRIRYLNSNIKSKFIWMTTVLVLDNRTKSYKFNYRESPIRSVDCAIATLHQCSYMWKKNNSDWFFSGSIINFTSAYETAVYTCNATCLVRDTNCSFIPAKVAFTCEMSDMKSTYNAGVIAVVIGVVSAVVIILVCAIVAVIFFRKIIKKGNGSDAARQDYIDRNEADAATSEETIRL